MLCIWCHINKLINFENSSFKSFSSINFSIPSDWRQLSSLPKPTTQMKMMEFEQKKKRRRTMQNICSVTMWEVWTRETNYGLMYKPRPWFLAQKFSKKV